VLFSTLAQINQAKERRSARRPKREATMTVVEKEPKAAEKVDAQRILERKILEVLLLYGEREETFEEYFEVIHEEGETEEKKESTDPTFRSLYEKITNEYNQKESLDPKIFIQDLPAEESAIVSDILMEEERYDLHDWERAEIYVKDKESGIKQLVEETILSL